MPLNDILARLFRAGRVPQRPAPRPDDDIQNLIQRKWTDDSRDLPLTEDHRELYELIHACAWNVLGDFPNLLDCRDFNDRMQWLKLFDQRAEIVHCSDKIAVREHVKERVGERHLVRLYEVRERFSDIDLDRLPGSFVVKPNHDSGSTIIVRDKSNFDKSAAEAQIDAALERIYGWESGEWSYRFVPRRVLVEELLDPFANAVPPDYKFHCVNGRVKFAHYIDERDIDVTEQLVGRDGVAVDGNIAGYRPGTSFRKPELWDEMISVAQRVAEGFKFVRVDLYCVASQIYVGEMTFWPMSGLYIGPDQRAFGQLIDFDRTTFMPPILPLLLRKEQQRCR
jgi:hypothetical protein